MVHPLQGFGDRVPKVLIFYSPFKIGEKEMSKTKQFAVLGLGRFGSSIVKTLSENGFNVLACDADADIVQEVSRFATYVVQADVTDENAMKKLGLGNFDVVIVAIGTNLESSVMATLIAKEQGAKYVLSKARDNKQKNILEKVGADRVVLPEWEMGARVATSLITTNVIDYINLSEQFTIAEIEPLDEWAGLSIQKANIRAQAGLNVVAIRRGKRVMVSLNPNEVIEETDILVVVGETANIQRMRSKSKSKVGGIVG